MQEQKRAPENERNIKPCCLAACSATHFEWAMDVESDGSFLTVEEQGLGDLATSPSSAVSEGALAPCRDVFHTMTYTLLEIMSQVSEFQFTVDRYSCK